MRRPRLGRASLWGAFGFVLLLLAGNLPAPVGAPANPAGMGAPVALSAPSPPPSPAPQAAFIPITVNGSSVNLSSDFWGTTVNNEVRMLRGETNAVAATPARVLVWPGAMAGEDYDPLTNTHYNTYNGTPTPGLTNESQFVQMCRAMNCTAIMQVPAEIDNAAFAESIVNYTEVTLGFKPAYWMIGNEPELWSHWKVAWKNWPTTYTTGPTPTQFADEVLAYVADIRQVDNTTPILGLPASGCTCGSWTFDTWIADVLKVTGNKIQAVAFHEYPAGWLGTGDGSLLDFYATIQGAASIPVRLAAARAAINTSCPGCNVSVFISELGAALSWSAYGPYAQGFSGALSIASQMTQAMSQNLTNIDLFATELATTNSWFEPTGGVRPDYALYTQIFSHLGSQAFAVQTPGLGKSVYAIATIAPNDGGRRDLLVVNDNITQTATFTPKFPWSPAAAPVEYWIWNGSIHTTSFNATTWVEPYTPVPVPHQWPLGLHGNYTLPPQSMVLFEEYPSGATYVRVNETGLPASTPWYASIGSRFLQTTVSNLSLLLPPGAYAVSSVSIPLPIGGKEFNPTERLAPFSPTPAVISGAYTNVTLAFVPQWEVNVTPSPAEAGIVTPDVGWWNQSQPLSLSVTPRPGYAFERWVGWGPGSYNGTAHSITIVPTGRVNERATFVVGQEAILAENGLPANTPWSVTVRGYSSNTTTPTIPVWVPNGTWGYHVTPIPGYRILPENGSFTINGGTIVVNVRFQIISPPGPQFPVQFVVTGLPAGMTVPITVRGASQVAGVALPLYDLWNGSYAYQVGYVAGYHAEVKEKLFNVTGGPVVVTVPFVPTVYPVVWKAIGVRSGLNWSVVLNGTELPANSAWLADSVPNGTYSYSVRVPANYTVTPRVGDVLVDESTTEFTLTISLLEFPAEFDGVGLSGDLGWSVRLGNLTTSATGAKTAFLAPNGTFTFDVHPPAGYYAVPSHGNLTVAGVLPPTPIHFLPTSNQPSAALVAQLSAGALSVSLWISVSVAGGFFLFRRFRRRGP